MFWTQIAKGCGPNISGLRSESRTVAKFPGWPWNGLP